MKEVIEFLCELSTNNNRDWFNENKGRYTQIQNKINHLTEQLIEAVSGFDPSVKGLNAKDCTYRIYRDTRFSHDKSPYKTHIGIYVCPGGKKSRLVGYYFHMEPCAEKEEYRFFIVTGTYCLATSEMNSIREDIVLEGDSFDKTVRAAKGFNFGNDEMYKRVPNGFPADSPYAHYLKAKNFQLLKTLSEKDVLSDGLVETIAGEFKKTYEFKERLNRAIEYAREDKM